MFKKNLKEFLKGFYESSPCCGFDFSRSKTRAGLAGKVFGAGVELALLAIIVYSATSIIITEYQLKQAQERYKIEEVVCED